VSPMLLFEKAEPEVVLSAVVVLVVFAFVLGACFVGAVQHVRRDR
jgi:hypothetical protein